MNFRAAATCLIALLAVAFVRAEDYDFKESFSRAGAFRADGQVTIENVNGNITIETWERNEIRIEGEKSARTDDELKLIELTMDVSESRADIRVKLPKRKGWFGTNSIRARVQFKLMVPATANLERIRTVNSAVEIVGARGLLNAETVNGRIRANDLGGDATLRTVNGRLEASFATMAPGQDVSCHTVNGSIRVELPADAGFELRSSVVNGHVDSDFPVELRGRVSNRRLSGKVGDGRAAISVQSVNGSIRLEKR